MSPQSESQSSCPPTKSTKSACTNMLAAWQGALQEQLKWMDVNQIVGVTLLASSHLKALKDQLWLSLSVHLKNSQQNDAGWLPCSLHGSQQIIFSILSGNVVIQLILSQCIIKAGKVHYINSLFGYRSTNSYTTERKVFSIILIQLLWSHLL